MIHIRHTIFIFILFFSSLSIYAQSRWNIDIGAAFLSLRKEVGIGSNLNMEYAIGDKHSVYGGATYYSVYLEKSNVNTIFYQLGGNYHLTNGDTKISTINGFTLAQSERNVFFDKKISLGIDLGIMFTFNSGDKFRYGLKWYNTFNPESKGTIMQINTFISFNL